MRTPLSRAFTSDKLLIIALDVQQGNLQEARLVDGELDPPEASAVTSLCPFLYDSDGLMSSSRPHTHMTAPFNCICKCIAQHCLYTN